MITDTIGLLAIAITFLLIFILGVLVGSLYQRWFSKNFIEKQERLINFWIETATRKEAELMQENILIFRNQLIEEINEADRAFHGLNHNEEIDDIENKNKNDDDEEDGGGGYLH